MYLIVFYDYLWAVCSLFPDSGGTLADYIQKRCNSLLDEDTILHFFVQILLALYHVHNKFILHRDLKTQNILLDKHQMIVKIGDFGISKILVSKSKAYTVGWCPNSLQLYTSCYFFFFGGHIFDIHHDAIKSYFFLTGGWDPMLHFSRAVRRKALQPEEWHLGFGLCALWAGQP